MFTSSRQTISEFREILLLLPLGTYTKNCQELSNSTIGQHTRHIIELYQCLIAGYELEEVNYDKRERNKQIEQDLSFALEKLKEISNELERKDRALGIIYELNGNQVLLTSNYFREVMYNLEHMIHHQALIRVAVQSFCDMQVPESFGVAPSTLQYRSVCVQ